MEPNAPNVSAYPKIDGYN